MAKYTVPVGFEVKGQLEVEADSPEEARQKAYEQIQDISDRLERLLAGNLTLSASA